MTVINQEEWEESPILPNNRADSKEQMVKVNYDQILPEFHGISINDQKEENDTILPGYQEALNADSKDEDDATLPNFQSPEK